MKHISFNQIAWLILIFIGVSRFARAGGDFDSISTPVIRGEDNLTISGWAIPEAPDRCQDQMGAPSVFIDGHYVGIADGNYRPDRQDNSGWHFTYNTGELSLGMHTILVTVYHNILDDDNNFITAWEEVLGVQQTFQVINVFPQQTFSGPTTGYVGQSINVSLAATNPTSSSGYQIGFRISELREDSEGNALPTVDKDGQTVIGWADIGYASLSSGNQNWSATRPAPTVPGKITYHYYSWNQWMGEYDNMGTLEIPVVNRAPSVTISPSSPPVIYYGQSLIFSSTATDPDNNLATHTWAKKSPGGTWSTLLDDVSGGGPNSDPVTREDTLVGTAIGAWTVRYDVSDTYGATASSAEVIVNVSRSTPAGDFSNRAIEEGVPLSTATHLNAIFSHNGTAVPGNVTYEIWLGGMNPYPNGTVLHAGDVLPAGTSGTREYTVRASIAASSFYNEATVDAEFTVLSNPLADNDNDGVNNGTEYELGTNPNSLGEINPTALKFKINTPRP